MKNNDETLPWQIVVHFKVGPLATNAITVQNFPSSELIRMQVSTSPTPGDTSAADKNASAPSLDAVESHYMQAVKEADQLKHRGDIMNAMQKREHKLMWNALCTGVRIGQALKSIFVQIASINIGRYADD
jgi:hypothetical protein